MKRNNNISSCKTNAGMKKKILVGPIVAIGLAILTIANTAAAQSGSSRLELQRHDLSISGREVIQIVVTIGKGETFPKHKHPGEEIIYVLKGMLEYQVGDKPPVALKAGEFLFVPYGVFHSAKNVGNGNAEELATYVVEKGKPLVTLVK
jgi:quercetin dioxygenase-like cupin family protein